MKKILLVTILSGFALMMSGTPILQKNTYALSCAPFFHKVGTVKEIEPSIILEHTYVYNIDQSFVDNPYTSKLFTSPALYAIDTYENIIGAYMDLPKKLSKPTTIKLNESSSVTFTPVENTSDFDKNKVSSVPKGLEGLSIGDILIIGGPVNGCRYSLWGGFTKDGTIKNILLDTAFSLYAYRGVEVAPNIEKELECGEFSCDVSVRFRVGEEEFVLSRGESFSLKDKNLASIKLVSADKVKSDILQIAGLPSESLSFILTFKDDKPSEPEELSMPEEPTGPEKPEPDIKSPEEVSIMLIKDGLVHYVDKITLRKSETTVQYEIRGRKKVKLLFLIPLQIKLQLSVDAMTGEIISIKKPWWSFLTS